MYMISNLFNRSNYLYNIVSLDNLESIFTYGILSKNKVNKNITYTDISNKEVQNRRENILVNNNRFLHDYANLYFNPRNAMLYARLSQIDNLCILRIDKSVLDWPDTIICDRNAAVGGAKFMSPAVAAKKLDFDIIYAKSWNLQNPYDKMRYKYLMMAEILVYEKIPPNLIKEIWVGNEIAFMKAKSLNLKVPVIIYPKAFFHQGKEAKQ